MQPTTTSNWPMNIWPTTSHLKEPKVLFLPSLQETNCSAIFFLFTLSSLSLCTWHTATLLRRVWVMVLRSHVFSLRRLLKLLSDSADDTGTTRRSRATVSTCSKRPRTSGFIPWRTATISVLDWKLYFILNNASWTLRLSGLISGYCWTTPCIFPVKRTCSRCLNICIPSCSNLSLNCMSATSRTL